MTSARLTWEPLSVEHAAEMAPLLDDVALHDFIGGAPETAPESCNGATAGSPRAVSPDGTQQWRNWVLRRRDTGRPVGTVQATVTAGTRDGPVAEYRVGDRRRVPGAGHTATEAAQALVTGLREAGVRTVVAHIHPGHVASMAVARGGGAHPYRRRGRR